jgi:exopolysaccharide production protein ExoZ
MFFYLVFGLLISFSLGYRILLIGLLFSIAVVGGRLFDPGTLHPIVRMYTDPILFEFLAGMIIGYIILRTRAFPASLACVFVAAAFILLVVPVLPEVRAISYGMPALLLVCGVVNLERLGLIPRLKVWNFLGDASYSIYLSHIFSFGLWRAVWARAGLVHDNPVSADLFAATSLVVAALCGGLVYTVIERPLLKRLRIFVSGRAVEAEPAMWTDPGATAVTPCRPARESLS